MPACLPARPTSAPHRVKPRRVHSAELRFYPPQRVRSRYLAATAEISDPPGLPKPSLKCVPVLEVIIPAKTPVCMLVVGLHSEYRQPSHIHSSNPHPLRRRNSPSARPSPRLPNLVQSLQRPSPAHCLSPQRTASPYPASAASHSPLTAGHLAAELSESALLLLLLERLTQNSPPPLHAPGYPRSQRSTISCHRPLQLSSFQKHQNAPKTSTSIHCLTVP